MHDLGIEGATVITDRGRAPMNVYVSNGRIAALSTEVQVAGRRVQGQGLYLMPGMVDAHVHFMDPGATDREDFPTASAAALRAGVTTVLEHTHSSPVRTAEDLHDKAAYLAGRSRVDFGLGAHAWPERADRVRGVWEAGASFVKAFTCTTHGVPGHGPAELHQLLSTAGEAGALCMLHCEDESLTSSAERALKAAGRLDGGVVPLWRNRTAELTAISVAALLTRLTRARAVIAHVSNPEALAIIRRDVQAGANLVVETCPQYLHCLEQEVLELGALRKFTPPARARSRADLDAMWDAVAGGMIDYVSTDHAPSTREQKAHGSIWDVHFGLPGIDTTLPFLLDAASRGRISYEQVVDLYSSTPSRVYGLTGKGRVVVGADADLVLVDPAARWTVRDEDVLSRAGWSPFSGSTFAGRPVQTYLRGELVMDEGRVLGEAGTGRFVAGPGATESR